MAQEIPTRTAQELFQGDPGGGSNGGPGDVPKEAQQRFQEVPGDVPKEAQEVF